MDQVFHQDLILEIIVEHAILNGNNTLLRENICALRLVQKRWLKVITKILQKKRQPLYKLELNTENSIEGSNYVTDNGKLLDLCVNSVTSGTRLDSGYDSLYCLRIMTDYFRLENHASLSNCLSDAGPRLTELEMFLPVNGGSFPCVLPVRMYLPLLKKLTVHLTDKAIVNLTENETSNPSDSDITYLLHSILNAAQNLTDFSVPVPKKLPRVPHKFHFLIFPKTIARLDLTSVTESRQLELLTSRDLPALSVLKLLVTHIPLSDGLLYRILDKFKTTLKNLVIKGKNTRFPTSRSTFLRFPEMKTLETIAIIAIDCELEPDLPPLETNLPNLKTLLLFQMTLNTFHQWTRNSKYGTVKTLAVGLVGEQDNYNTRHEYQFLSIDVETVQKLHVAFPNIRKLNLMISPSQACGLKYIFMEMLQVAHFGIRVTGSDPNQNGDFWDALLIGSTEQLAAGLRSSPDYLEFVKFETDTLPSIKMLRELISFNLDAYCPQDHSTEAVKPLISDVAFQFALLKMPKLVELSFKGRFLVSEKMADIWRRDGRKLNYSSSKQSFGT